MAEYEVAKGNAAPKEKVGVILGTWRWLCVRYFAECPSKKVGYGIPFNGLVAYFYALQVRQSPMAN